MTENAKKSITRLVISGFLIAVVLIIAYLIFDALGVTDLTRQQIQDFISSTGVIAPLVFIGVSFLQVTFIPVPGLVTIIAGTYLFGPWLSFLYSYIGMLIGSVVAWGLGRLLGRPYVNWVAGSKEQADEWLKKLKGREKVFLFFAFLLPLFPDDLLCSVAGILPIRFSTFFIMQLITRFTSIGASIIFMSGEIIPYHGWGLWVLGLLTLLSVVIFILAVKKADELNQLFDNMINRIAGKTKKEKKS